MGNENAGINTDADFLSWTDMANKGLMFMNIDSAEAGAGLTIGGVGYLIGVPTSSVAASYPVWVGGEQITDLNWNGEGWRYNADSSTLTLDNFTYTGPGQVRSNGGGAIFSEIPLNIELKGTNILGITAQGGSVDGVAGIFIRNAGVNIKGTGTLHVTGCDNSMNSFGIYSEDGNIKIKDVTVYANAGNAGAESYSAGISSKTLSIYGTANVTASSKYGKYSYAIHAENIGIAGNADVTALSGGTTDEGFSVGVIGVQSLYVCDNACIETTGGEAANVSCGIQTSKMLVSGNPVIIANGGHAPNGSVGIATEGDAIVISGGNITANGGLATAQAAESAGIQAYSGLTVTGGVIKARGYDCDAASNVNSVGITVNENFNVTIVGTADVTAIAGSGRHAYGICGGYITFGGTAKVYAETGETNDNIAQYPCDNAAIAANVELVIKDNARVEAYSGLSDASSRGIMSQGTAEISGNPVIIATAGNSISDQDTYDCAALLAIGNMTISGGDLTLTGGNSVTFTDLHSYGIISEGGNIVISGGNITAKSGSTRYSYAIAGPNITVNGNSQVSAVGGSTDSGVSNNGHSAGIYGGASVTISDSSVVEAVGSASDAKSLGLWSGGTIDILGNVIVEARGGNVISDPSSATYGINAVDTITISGGTVNAMSGSVADVLQGVAVGIDVGQALNVFGGKITASSGAAHVTYGILARESMNVSGGSIDATAGAGGVDGCSVGVASNGIGTITGGKIRAISNAQNTLSYGTSVQLEFGDAFNPDIIIEASGVSCAHQDELVNIPSGGATWVGQSSADVAYIEAPLEIDYKNSGYKYVLIAAALDGAVAITDGERYSNIGGSSAVTVLGNGRFTAKFVTEYLCIGSNLSFSSALPSGTKLILTDMNNNGGVYVLTLSEAKTQIALSEFKKLGTNAAYDDTAVISDIDYQLCVEVPSSNVGSFTVNIAKGAQGYLAAATVNMVEPMLPTSVVIGAGKLTFNIADTYPGTLLVTLLDENGNEIDYPAGSGVTLNGAAVTVNRTTASMPYTAGTVEISGLIEGNYKLRLSAGHIDDVNNPAGDIAVTATTETLAVASLVRPTLLVVGERHIGITETLELTVLYASTSANSVSVTGTQFKSVEGTEFEDCVLTITKGAESAGTVAYTVNGFDDVGTYVIEFTYGSASYSYQFIVG